MAERFMKTMLTPSVIAAQEHYCPKYITPRYTAGEVESIVTPLRQRISDLEAQIKKQ